MTEHSALTGDSLHEPKGADTATSGQVYVSDGAGSGTWTSRLAGIVNLNLFSLSGKLTDISNPGDNVFHSLPFKSQLNKVFVTLYGAITTANSVLTIYKNGIAQTPTITVPFSGSGAGIATSANISPAIAFNEGDVIEIRSDGASSATASATVTARFTAVV